MCVVHWNPGPACIKRGKVKENAGPSARVNEGRAAMLALEELRVWCRGTAAWHHHSRNPSSRASFCHIVLPDLFFHMGQLTFGVMSCDKRCCSASVPMRLRCLKQPRGLIYPFCGMAAAGRCGFCCHLFVSLLKPE